MVVVFATAREVRALHCDAQDAANARHSGKGKWDRRQKRQTLLGLELPSTTTEGTVLLALFVDSD